MYSWAGGEIEWKRKNVDFLECYSPLPEDQAGEKEGERTEGYGRPPPLITSYTHESNKMHQVDCDIKKSKQNKRRDQPNAIKYSALNQP